MMLRRTAASTNGCHCAARFMLQVRSRLLCCCSCSKAHFSNPKLACQEVMNDCQHHGFAMVQRARFTSGGAASTLSMLSNSAAKGPKKPPRLLSSCTTSVASATAPCAPLRSTPADAATSPSVSSCVVIRAASMSSCDGILLAAKPAGLKLGPIGAQVRAQSSSVQAGHAAGFRPGGNPEDCVQDDCTLLVCWWAHRGKQSQDRLRTCQRPSSAGAQCPAASLG